MGWCCSGASSEKLWQESSPTNKIYDSPSVWLIHWDQAIVHFIICSTKTPLILDCVWCPHHYWSHFFLRVFISRDGMIASQQSGHCRPHAVYHHNCSLCLQPHKYAVNCSHPLHTFWVKWLGEALTCRMWPPAPAHAAEHCSAAGRLHCRQSQLLQTSQPAMQWKNGGLLFYQL
jgi:hypothetical protein